MRLCGMCTITGTITILDTMVTPYNQPSLFFFNQNITMTSTHPIRILSIDGGGIFGLIPLHVLSLIENHTQRPIVDTFDYISGTSSGGIIALALSCPDHAHRPRYTAHDVMKEFIGQAPLIFSKSWTHKMLSWLPIIKYTYPMLFPKYIDAPAKQAFHHLFGDVRLSQALKPTLVATYALTKPNPELVVFNSASSGPNSKNNKPDFWVKDIAFATSAAPTLFPPQKIHCLREKQDPHALAYPFIDGGIAMNNMSLFVYAHARKKHPNHPIHILSLGQRRSPVLIDHSQSAYMGWLSWLKKADSLITPPQNSGQQAVLKKLISQSAHPDTYTRIQPVHSPAFKDFDTVTSSHMSSIMTIAQMTCEKNHSKIMEYLNKK